MVRFIADEAELAASLLDVTNTADNVGRPTRGTALMLKGKTFSGPQVSTFRTVRRITWDFLMTARPKCLTRQPIIMSE